MPRDLSTLTVAVTGGARGIGAATVRLLRDSGAAVVIGDRDQAVAEQTAAAHGARALPLDVADPESWHSFVEAAGPLDVLVHNAGIMPIGDVLEEPDEVTRRIFEVNTFGVIHGTKAVVPGMIERGHGHVVNVASAVGRVAAAGGATYSASKHAVVGFSEATRLELAPHGIDVSMVLPAVVRTELAAGIPESRALPTVDPEDVAAVIVATIRRPVAEAWVPRWAQTMAKVTMTLPRRVQLAMAKVFDADAVLADVDESARAAYEARARRRAEG
ncbi:MAG TPA: SDR family oxidoreductase [Nocardioides sp.]|nr:SDR family oxidoreductase [Nocardioides sp.]